jgi:uncharacterized delta-60 repeat protein
MLLQFLSHRKRNPFLPKLLWGLLALCLAFGASGIDPYVTSAAGQDGAVDPTFQSGSGPNNDVGAIAVQTDGKILIGGNFTSYNGVGRNRIARLNADGSLDPGFEPGAGSNGHVETMAMQTDGKVLITGGFTSYNGVGRNRIARLNPDGSLDPGFEPGVGTNNSVLAIVVQGDGKILIGGFFTTYNGVGRNRIARLNADGSLDPGFEPGAGANSVVQTIAVQGDGKVLIGGFFTSVDTSPQSKIARLENRIKATSSVALTSSPNSSEFGQSVTFTATLTPITGTGTITFTFGGSASVTSTVASGVATYVTNTMPIGETDVTATYSGNANLLVSVSPIYTQTVTKAATSITVTSAPNSSLVGQMATFTATVSPSAATGTVTFTIGITNVTASLSSGVATYVTDTLPIGSYTVTATYGGSAVYSDSVSFGQYTHTVVAACNTLIVTNNTDDGAASTCGTFSYALLSATSGMTVTFGVTNVTFTGVLTPTLQAGVVIDGGANGVTLDGGTLTGDGLELGGDNKLINLTILSKASTGVGWLYHLLRPVTSSTGLG